MLDFQDKELTKLKECFEEISDLGMEEQKQGQIKSLTNEQLEIPLIGLGFADSREEIDEMIKAVDDNGSGNIEFNEFLSIITNNGGDEKTAKIFNFFKGVTSGTIQTKDGENFNQFVTRMRTNFIMDYFFKE